MQQKTLINTLVWIGLLIPVIWFFSNCPGPPTQYETGYESRGQDSENLPGVNWGIQDESKGTLNALQFGSIIGDTATTESAIYVGAGWDCLISWEHEDKRLCWHPDGTIMVLDE